MNNAFVIGMAVELTVVLGAGLAAPALAQETTPPVATPLPIDVAVGPYDFAVDGDEPLTACVVSRSESLDGIFLGVQVMVRTEGGDYVPIAAYDTRATAALKDAHVSDCYILAPEK